MRPAPPKAVCSAPRFPRPRGHETRCFAPPPNLALARHQRRPARTEEAFARAAGPSKPRREQLALVRRQNAEASKPCCQAKQRTSVALSFNHLISPGMTGFVA